MAYTTIDKPTDYFNTKLYTGTGSQLAVTGVGFQPDWIWYKNRGTTNSHGLQDVVRGFNTTGIQSTNGSDADPAFNGSTLGYVSAVGSDGFTVEAGNCANASSNNYVSWNWLAGGTSSSNTDGDLTVTSLSVNQTAGFSIGKITNGFTSTGSNSETVGHGLNAIPKMIILKNIEATSNWFVYHASLGNTNRIFLNTTDASSSSTIWNNTTPTSSVWSVRGGDFGTGEDVVFYAFAEKKGFSKFGSYTGNGDTNNAPFIYTGFKPAMIIVKNTTGNNWGIFDNKRSPHNVVTDLLLPNSNAANDGNTNPRIDMLSNGFKPRTNDGLENPSAEVIYMAFAESPFVTSTGIPTTAR